MKRREPQQMPVVPQITDPCGEAWEMMPGSAMVRHCGLCDKDVFNTAAMSTDQIRKLVAGPLPCLRVSRYDDGSLVTLEPAPVTHRSPLAAGVLMAAMSFASASAQSPGAPGPNATMGVPPMAPRVTISGHMTDHEGRALPNLHVTVLANGQKAEQLATDQNGRFSVQLPPGGYQLVVKGAGFVTRTLPLNAEKTVELAAPIEVARIQAQRGSKATTKPGGRSITVIGGQVAPPEPFLPPPSTLPLMKSSKAEPAPAARKLGSITVGTVEVTAEGGSITPQPANHPLPLVETKH